MACLFSGPGHVGPDVTIRIDFSPGSRFSIEGVEGFHPVHDTVEKRDRHLNFFQHESFLLVRTPRVKLPDGSVRLVELDWAGRLKGFTLLFEALVLTLAREMTFSAVARLTGESWHRVTAICKRYPDHCINFGHGRWALCSPDAGPQGRNPGGHRSRIPVTLHPGYVSDRFWISPLVESGNRDANRVSFCI